ncbi:TetR/AcrR family transcriptional regulator [Streptomyces nogalater]
MSTARERILAATEELLASKDALAISTRAICDRAKVGMPEIYRQFGDKQGLLTAVACIGFERFLANKRRNPMTDDPVADLRTAWDSHVAFALDNPHLYRLMFTPAPDSSRRRSRRPGPCCCRPWSAAAPPDDCVHRWSWQASRS